MIKLMVMMMLASCISGRYEVTGGTKKTRLQL